MKYTIAFLIFASIAFASDAVVVKFENHTAKAKLRQLTPIAYHLEIERVDGKSIAPQIDTDWVGLSLIFEDECHGSYCSFKGGARLFGAWDRDRKWIKLEAPSSARVLVSSRLHFEATFKIDGKEILVSLSTG